MEAIEAGKIDLILVLLLVLLAGASLLLPQLFRAVMAFIGFGLVMAVVWVRLDAVDIALVEAMIGSGITGALFLASLGRMARAEDKGDTAAPPRMASARPIRLNGEGSLTRQASRWSRVIAAAIISVATGLVFSMVFPLPEPDGTIKALVIRNLLDSGVSNPVTAVLLNFRAYDTLLEIGVVLLTVVGLRAVGGDDRFDQPPYPDRLLTGFYRLILPFLILFSAYMVWVGKYEPGGAFQAAALLAAGGIMGGMVGANPGSYDLRRTGLRIIAAAGFAVFLSLGVLLWVQSGLFLRFAPQSAGWFILVVEVVATVSLAFSLIVLFHGSSGNSLSYSASGSVTPTGKESE